jgi:GTP-binding protein Era
VLVVNVSFFAAEMIRGAILQEFQKEVPYCCEVRITEFKEPLPESKKPIIRMKATIFVERENQKLIVIGKGGQQIKRVGIVSREQLESFFQTQVRTSFQVAFRSANLSL